MSYSEMEDFTISVLVGRATGLATRHDSALGLVVRNDSGLKFDPVNSWADSGPIIQANQINLNSITQGWIASDNGAHDCNYSVHENPMRAAMIVFLMMQEKNDEQ